ncbi:hypothetical protein F4780DRAFT_293883 [Xylariomycetidae sp. FL0641]|nr:hypothetical protein F4780DRAFT_293883 [Xylariomycetidae sp. FL0641]
MEASAAVGVAAAACQFLELSIKVVKLCREVHENAQSATTHNQELEENSKRIRDYRSELAASNRAPDRIKQIAGKCVEQSDDLMKLLKKTRRNGKLPSVVRAVYRAIKEAKPIGELQVSLERTQEMLNQAIVQDLW